MIQDITKTPNTNYQAYLVVAWARTTKSDLVANRRGEVELETFTITEPHIFSCNTTEELVQVVDECKAKNWKHNIFKTTKITLKQSVTLDIEE